MKQDRLESIEQFCMRIRKLAAECGYPNKSVEEQNSIQTLITGATNPWVKRALLNRGTELTTFKEAKDTASKAHHVELMANPEAFASFVDQSTSSPVFANTLEYNRTDNTLNKQGQSQLPADVFNSHANYNSARYQPNQQANSHNTYQPPNIAYNNGNNRGSYNGKNEGFTRSCWHCGDTSHFRRDCPSFRGNRQTGTGYQNNYNQRPNFSENRGFGQNRGNNNPGGGYNSRFNGPSQQSNHLNGHRANHQ